MHMYTHVYTYLYIHAYMYTCTCAARDPELKKHLEMLKAALRKQFSGALGESHHINI